MSKKIFLAIILTGCLLWHESTFALGYSYFQNDFMLYSPDSQMTKTNLAESESGNARLEFSSYFSTPVEWLGFIIPLDVSNFEDWKDYYGSLENKRETYQNEDAVMVLFAASSSLTRVSDISGLITDITSKLLKIGVVGFGYNSGYNIENRYKIHLVRAYSGGWGKFEDADEKEYVLSNFPHAKERMDKAFTINLVLSGVDLIRAFIPIDAVDTKVAKRILIEKMISSMLETIGEHREILPSNREGDLSQTDYLSLMYDIMTKTIAVLNEKIYEKSADEAQRVIMERLWRICETNAKVAIEQVNVFKKAGLLTKVSERYVNLFLSATPVESHYVVPKDVHANFAKAKIKDTGEDTIDNNKDKEEKRLYKDEELKISFRYPENWGEMIKQELFGQDNRHFYSKQLYITQENRPIIVAGTRKTQDGFGLNGYWGNNALFVEDQNYINNYCEDQKDRANRWCSFDENSVYCQEARAISCEIRTNTNGISFVKTKSDDMTSYYFFNSNSENYKGLMIFSGGGGEYVGASDVLPTLIVSPTNIENFEEDLEALVDSLKFTE